MCSEPISMAAARLESVGIGYLLHCLTGWDHAADSIVFDHLEA